MGTFSLTHAAKNDLRGIARFTEDRWGRAQRRHHLKGLDEVRVLHKSRDVHQPASLPDAANHRWKKQSDEGAALFYIRGRLPC